MLSSLAISLILTQWTTQGIRVIDEGITKGYATQVNCVGPLTCDSNGTIWTLTVTGGGGGAPTDATYVTMSANASLSAEVVVPTCTGTDKLTSNGSAISCATDQTGATSPGGSNTQLQYNNAGSFGGMARVTTDGNDLVITRQSTHPSSPATGFVKSYGFGHHGTASPTLLQPVDGETELEVHPFPITLAQDDHWGCVTPAGSGNTTISSAGFAAYTGNTTGTAASAAWAATDERTRHPFVQFSATAAANVSAGVRANADVLWRGNAAGLGGFYLWGTTNIVGTSATQRVFMGAKDATAVITATTDPSAALDTVYFGCNSAGTTINVCSNDNSGAATCTDLGANFPCKTANTAYDWAFWTAPNASSIKYYIRRLVNGSEAQGTISSDLPRNSVALGWDVWVNSGATSGAPTMQFGGVCYVANP